MKTIVRLLLGALALILSIAGCNAREPVSVGVTGIVYNYSQEGYARIKINGKIVGTTLKKVEPGAVSGGGGMCCFELPANAKQIEVELEPSLSDGFKTTATIEKWWPDLAHYGVVHILPGRKVVMQVTPSAPRPRKDLLEARQQELGMERKILFDYWSAGPVERIDGKQ